MKPAAANFHILLGCYAVGAVISTVSAIVGWLRGKPITWREFGGALLVSGLVYYGILGFLFILATPFIAIWYFFFR